MKLLLFKLQKMSLDARIVHRSQIHGKKITAKICYWERAGVETHTCVENFIEFHLYTEI